jgi:flagellar biogenesis protein FliO
LRAPSTSLSQRESHDAANDAVALPGEKTDLRTAAATHQSENSDAGSSTRPTTAAPLVTIASSLALVLGLFAAFVWASRKAQRGRGISRPIPDEVLRVLGQKHLGTLGTISIIRCGRTVMIVSQTATGIQPLATITDEAEIRHLEAVCLGESAASFQAALGEIEREPAGRGFLGEGIAQPHARKKLFTEA